jgi:hypothetical protein
LSGFRGNTTEPSKGAKLPSARGRKRHHGTLRVLQQYGPQNRIAGTFNFRTVRRGRLNGGRSRNTPDPSFVRVSNPAGISIKVGTNLRTDAHFLSYENVAIFRASRIVEIWLFDKCCSTCRIRHKSPCVPDVARRVQESSHSKISTAKDQLCDGARAQ